jgi:glycosyltransferase involved in cell wall biosynthesis
MKILYVDQTGQLGGGELSLLDWLRISPQSATVVLFEDGPFRALLEELGVAVEVLPLAALKEVRRESGLWRLLTTVPAWLSLRTRLAQAAGQADLLYANSQKAFLLSAFARRSGQPLIWHLRDILTGEHFSPILRRIAVFTGNRFATAIIVNSKATADAFVAAGGRPQLLREVPDGVSARPFDEVDPKTVKLLRQEICAPDKILIGVFGRLAEWKGQHILLEAIVNLPDVHLCVVGDALFGEKAYAETLKRRAAQDDLAERVTFLGFRRDIPELMKCMDIVVHSSIVAEPLGRVILEGMLAGKPVIATRAGGAAEIVQDRENGLLVTPGSAIELFNAIKLLCTDSKLSQELALAGRRRAEQDYSLEIMANRVRRVLQESSAKSQGGKNFS